jgi:protein-S-isoprenylcysteine O-methyltransferase Ste14
MLGSAITAGTGYAFAGVAVVAASFVIKSRREEKMLAKEFGTAYAQFKQHVPTAIIPFVY